MHGTTHNSQLWCAVQQQRHEKGIRGGRWQSEEWAARASCAWHHSKVHGQGETLPAHVLRGVLSVMAQVSFLALLSAPPLIDVYPVMFLREISKLVIVHVKAKVHRLLQKRKADVARTMDIYFFHNATTQERGSWTGAMG